MYNPIKHLRAIVNYTRAVRMADDQFARSGQRQYVIRGAHRTLLVCDRKSFRMLKRHYYIKRNATVKDLEQNCFYCTSYRDGKDPMPEQVVTIKRKQCISWLRSPIQGQLSWYQRTKLRIKRLLTPNS